MDIAESIMANNSQIIVCTNLNIWASWRVIDLNMVTNMCIWYALSLYIYLNLIHIYLLAFP